MTRLVTLRGMGDPTGTIVASFFNGDVADGMTSVTVLPYVQTGLEGLMGAFGKVITPAMRTTLDAAVEMLDDELHVGAEDITVMAHSLGAMVAVIWLIDYGPDSDIDPDRLNFILVGNPLRKYGGEISVVGDRFDIPHLVIPDDTPYDVLDVTNQYDPWADWPSRLFHTSFLPAVANAIAGTPTAHVLDYLTADLANPDAIDYHDPAQANVTYRLLPTYPLPLLTLTPEPLRMHLDAFIRPMIEAAYDRPISLVLAPPPPDPPFDYGDCEIVDWLEPAHFCLKDGVITPQPWMQWRQVAGVEAASKSQSYNVVGGINKNELIHYLTTTYTNTTPIDQWVYGLITRGGCRVTLQARSRGYLQVKSGYAQDEVDPGPLEVASRVGVGADIGRGGVLAIGTSFCIAEERMNSVTFPLAPERAGWHRLPPGQTFIARAEVRFVTEQYEVTSIDGGTNGAESSWESGGTRLDLFAVPVI